MEKLLVVFENGQVKEIQSTTPLDVMFIYLDYKREGVIDFTHQFKLSSSGEIVLKESINNFTIDKA